MVGPVHDGTELNWSGFLIRSSRFAGDGHEIDLTHELRGLTDLVVHLIASAIVSEVLANDCLG